MTRKRVLTTEQVRAIRSSYKVGVKGCGYLETARKHGVPESTVRDCVNFTTYTYQYESYSEQWLKEHGLKKRIGEKIGIMTVVSYSHYEKGRHHWNVICECGNEKTISSQHFGSKIKSCGCLNLWHNINKHEREENIKRFIGAKK